MKQNYSLLQNFKQADFFNEPFPHLIIKNALPENLYKNLENSFPNEFIKNINQDNKRGSMLKEHFVDKENYKIWYDFLKYNSSNSFFMEFYNIFKESINFSNPALMNEVENYQQKIKSNNTSDEIEPDAVYGYNTPTKTPSSVRGVHLDTNDKLYIGLYYMRELNDKTKGGDLIIYNWKKNYNLKDKKKILCTEKFKYLQNHTEEFKKINYERNTLFLGLNTINSLHGVSTREKSNSVRQFCYLTSRLRVVEAIPKSSLFEKLQYDNISIYGKTKIIIYEMVMFIKKIFIKKEIKSGD